MKKNQIEYINASIDDDTQDIYRTNYGGANWSDIICTLPKGNYYIECKKTADSKNIYASLLTKGVKASKQNCLVGFYLDETICLCLPVTAGGGIETIITSLRKQALKNKKLYGKKSLIQQAINIPSTHNNLGSNLSINNDLSTFYFDVQRQL